ncbi:unnamed protein product [Paramecium sonneborni]|uniref:Uncharacterized protein n=1 Tax=Paramecium sonneborni TaxID=65129 RepID=A0A8S1NWY4_9CILI|nr:unnamed protein product [Paramecium sonneborni]
MKKSSFTTKNYQCPRIQVHKLIRKKKYLKNKSLNYQQLTQNQQEIINMEYEKSQLAQKEQNFIQLRIRTALDAKKYKKKVKIPKSSQQIPIHENSFANQVSSINFDVGSNKKDLKNVDYFH